MAINRERKKRPKKKKKPGPAQRCPISLFLPGPKHLTTHKDLKTLSWASRRLKSMALNVSEPVRTIRSPTAISMRF